MRNNNRRGRNNNNSRNNNRNSPNNGGKNLNPLYSQYNSIGPLGKIRGTAVQIVDKYSTAAQESMIAGDRVHAETLFQFAEHFSRMLVEYNIANPTPVKEENSVTEVQEVSTFDANDNIGKPTVKKKSSIDKANKGNSINTKKDNEGNLGMDVITKMVTPVKKAGIRHPKIEEKQEVS